jgi:hypothetical protein
MNLSGRTFEEEIRAFAAWVAPEAPGRRVRVLAYDYASETDWSFPDAPEVDAKAFEAILRSTSASGVTLSARTTDGETLVVALEYLSDPGGRLRDGDTAVWVNWRSPPSNANPWRMETLGVAVLTAGRVPGPPSPPFEVGVAYPLAFDVCDRIGAVSFAALDAYPDIDHGWWCFVVQFALHDGAWHPAGGEYDNTTILTPFARPSEIEWVDWGTHGGNGVWDEEPRDRHSYCGIAATGTARLTVTAEGRTRDVRITPWNGAYVVVEPCLNSALSGYDATGSLLGTHVTDNEPAPEYDESRAITLPFDPGVGLLNEPMITLDFLEPE